MHGKWRLALTALVLLAALALIGAVEFLPHTDAGRPANLGNNSTKIATVVIHGFKFRPAIVTVRAGEIVEWKNEDIVPHTVTADAEAAHNPVFDSGTIGTGAAWRYVAQKKGTYNYTCDYHPNMTGKLIVQ